MIFLLAEEAFVQVFPVDGVKCPALPGTIINSEAACFPALPHIRREQ